MKRFYLAGQRYFGNRGCEALVRTTVLMLREIYPDAEFVTPSVDPNLDRQQWPEAEASGVRFVRAVPFPTSLRWWYRAVRALPLMKRAWIPRSYALPRDILEDVRKCDAVIMIGGDNISLDYTAAGLLGNTAFSEMFMREGKPVVLWAASVGPFSADPVIQRYMADFLNRLDLLTVRETVSAEYLAGIGVRQNVRLVADPAFLLQAEEFQLEGIVPSNAEDILGFNVSPLVDGYGRSRADAGNTISEIVDFLEGVVRDRNLSVLMIPHVDPQVASQQGGDTGYMEPIYRRLAHLGERVRLAPPTLNAAQLKYLIRQCRYFIGARTHSTIAGLASGIPTLSIAYSVKARGLNRDLFGHERYVLPTAQLSASTLGLGLQSLIDDEDAIRSQLEQAIPRWQEKARLSARHLAQLLN